MADDSADAPVAPATAVTPDPDEVTPVTEPAHDEVTAKLTELGVDSLAVDTIKASLGITSLDDLSVLTVEDYLGAGIKPVQARKLVSEFTPVATSFGASTSGVLPSPLDNESWMTSLKSSGVLKVGETSYISAVRAAVADKADLFGLPARVIKAMEEQALVAEEPFTEEYYKLRDQVTRTDYGDIFSAIPGISGSYVTKGRKEDLLNRMNKYLWPALADFSTQLDGWFLRYKEVANDPMLVVNILSGKGIPSTMIMPDTSPLRDYSEEVTDTINKVFAGDGPIIASAMAVEAAQIRKLLTDSRLPMAVGATTRELMLKKLGVNVGSADARVEQDLTTFVLATVQFKDQPSGDTELVYAIELYRLGLQIPWDRLGRGNNTLSGVGGRTTLPARL